MKPTDMRVSSIDSRRLKKIIRKECGSCLIVDCRPYFSFSNSNIKGSVNVNLNSVIVRRSRGGPVPLQFVVPDEKALYRLKEGSISVVVALDDRTPHVHKLRKDSVAQIVINTLTASGANICFLKGGYEAFHSQYPDLCSEKKHAGSAGNETERVISSSHCVKPGARHKPDYDQGPPVELTPFLYLGSAYHASRHDFLSERRITALLNVSRRDTHQLAKGQYDYKWIPVEDSHTADISSHFQEAINFIDCVKNSGGKVLVHCEAGISRSPTICMAYLMQQRRIRLEEAFDIIRQRRTIISPNFNFMGQLLQFESEVLSSAPASASSSSSTFAVPLGEASSTDLMSLADIAGNGQGQWDRTRVQTFSLEDPSVTPGPATGSTISPSAVGVGASIGINADTEAPPPPTPGPLGVPAPSTFFTDGFELGQTWEEPSTVFTFPPSFLSPMALKPPVHQFKLSPLTALP